MCAQEFRFPDFYQHPQWFAFCWRCQVINGTIAAAFSLPVVSVFYPVDRFVLMLIALALQHSIRRTHRPMKRLCRAAPRRLLQLHSMLFSFAAFLCHACNELCATIFVPSHASPTALRMATQTSMERRAQTQDGIAQSRIY